MLVLFKSKTLLLFETGRRSCSRTRHCVFRSMTPFLLETKHVLLLQTHDIVLVQKPFKSKTLPLFSNILLVLQKTRHCFHSKREHLWTPLCGVIGVPKSWLGWVRSACHPSKWSDRPTYHPTLCSSMHGHMGPCQENIKVTAKQREPNGIPNK